MQPVHDTAVKHSGRPSQAVDEVACSARHGECRTEPFRPAASEDCPGSEQDHADERGGGEERFVACAQPEGGAVIDDELKAYQASGYGNVAPTGEPGQCPCLAGGVGRDPEHCYHSAPQSGFHCDSHTFRADARHRLPRNCLACHVTSLHDWPAGAPLPLILRKALVPCPQRAQDPGKGPVRAGAAMTWRCVAGLFSWLILILQTSLLTGFDTRKLRGLISNHAGRARSAHQQHDSHQQQLRLRVRFCPVIAGQKRTAIREWLLAGGRRRVIRTWRGRLRWRGMEVGCDRLDWL
jgi:hypothetical protein